MKNLLMFILIIGQSIVGSVYSQCKVLNSNISESYTGECKKGLAHGEGLATGVDSYKGNFVKGQMQGYGIYSWDNGDKYIGNWKKGVRNGFGEFVSIVAPANSKKGIWKNDAFVRAQKFEKMYEVSTKLNISTVSVRRISDGNRIYIKFRSSYGAIMISNLVLVGPGSEITDLANCGFDSANFPFETSISFTAPNALKTAYFEYKLGMIIYEPGSWEITINY